MPDIVFIHKLRETKDMDGQSGCRLLNVRDRAYCQGLFLMAWRLHPNHPVIARAKSAGGLSDRREKPRLNFRPTTITHPPANRMLRCSARSSKLVRNPLQHMTRPRHSTQAGLLSDEGSGRVMETR